ncbi:MAG: AI-2E family transporter [Sulfurovaceae bacterium]|nr:AI-2E family transporter [Sulfurovaceae bacterium]
MQQNLFARIMIVVTLGMLGWLFYPFMKSFFVALLMVIIFAPLHLLFEKYFKKHISSIAKVNIITAASETLILIVILFVPVLFFAYYLTSHPQEIINIGNAIYQQGSHILSLTPEDMHWLKKPLITIDEQFVANKDKIISTLAINFGVGIIEFFKTIGDMILIVIFFFLLSWYQRSLILAIVPIIPIPRSIIQEFARDLISTSATGFYALIVVGITQGIAFGIFISFFEGYNPLILGLMVAMTSVIPIFGTALIWIPIVLKEFFAGHELNALIIAIYSWAMISFFIDNIVRLLVLQKINRLLTRVLNKGHKPVNDFLIFFAIVAGLSTFGFWGVIFGPAIVAFATTLLRLLKHRHIKNSSLKA